MWILNLKKCCQFSSKEDAPIYGPVSKVWIPKLFDLLISSVENFSYCHFRLYFSLWIRLSFLRWQAISISSSVNSLLIFLIFLRAFPLLICSKSYRYYFLISLLTFFFLGFWGEVQKFVIRNSTFFFSSSWHSHYSQIFLK